MKEASGELNMTVITIVAIAAVGGLFYIFVWPMIQQAIVSQTCKTYGTGWKAVQVSVVDESTNAKVYKWKCCPPNANGSGVDKTSNRCVDSDYGQTAK